MKKHLLVMFSLCIVALFFAGHGLVCAQEKVEPVRIGCLVDFTGFLAEYAPKYRVMQDFYLDEIGWKVAGRPIKLFIEDSTTDAAKAIIKAKKLVEVDKVHMLVGTLWGSVVHAVSAYAAEVKIPHIIWGEAHYEALERGWSFAIQPPVEVGAYMAGKLAYDRGYRTAISIAPDYVAGHKYNGGAMQAFIDKGGKVLQKQWPPPDTMDFGPYITKMPLADVCIFWFPGTYQLVFAKQYKEFGLLDKMPLLTPTGDSIIKEVMSKTDLSLAGRVFGRTSYVPDIDTPANRKYVEAVRAKTGQDPDPLDTSAYIGMMLAHIGR